MPGTLQSSAITLPKGHVHSVAAADTSLCGVGWVAGSWLNASLQSTPLTLTAGPPLAWRPSSPPRGQHPRKPASPRTWSQELAPDPLEPLPELSSPRYAHQVNCIVCFTQLLPKANPSLCGHSSLCIATHRNKHVKQSFCCTAVCMARSCRHFYDVFVPDVYGPAGTFVMFSSNI